MEGVQDPSTESKGKGKATNPDAMEESMDDDSSDESGVEDQVRQLYGEIHSRAQKLTLYAPGWRRYTTNAYTYMQRFLTTM